MTRLINKTHLYVMSTTNLFHLEDSSDKTELKDLKINVSRKCASSHEFRKISNMFNRSVYTDSRSRSIYHRIRSATLMRKSFDDTIFR